MKIKVLVLYFISNIAAIWLTKQFLSGFNVSSVSGVFILAFVLLGGLILNELINEKLKSAKGLLFFLIGILIMFFAIYFSSFFVPNFDVTGGSLDRLQIGFLQTPSLRSVDQILTLMLSGLIIMIVTSITRWAGNIGKKSD